MNRLKKIIFRAFEMMNRCYDGAEGAASGGEGAGEGEGGEGAGDGEGEIEGGEGSGEGEGEGEGGEEEVSKDQFDEFNIDPEVRDDPTVIESVKQMIKDKAEEAKKKKEEEGAGEGEGGEGAGEGEGEGEGGEGSKDKKDKEEFDYTFEKDITIGEVEFKKEDLANTPVKVLANITSIQTQLEEANEKLTESNNKITQFSDDPVVKNRFDRIKAGDGDKPYEVFVASKETEKYIIDNFDLDPEDAEDAKLIQGLYKEMQADMRFNVDKIVDNVLVSNKAKTDDDELVQKGVEKLLSIQNYIDKDLRIEEKDLNAIIKAKGDHAEWDKFNNEKGLGTIQKTLYKMGYTNYKQLVDIPAKSLFAMAAAEMGIPIAFNTKDRDKKIIQDKTDQILKMFSGKKVAKALGSGSGGSKRSKSSILENIEIDDKKVLDYDYAQSVYDQCTTDDQLEAAQVEIATKVAKLQNA